MKRHGMLDASGHQVVEAQGQRYHYLTKPE
jgi:hypothetical protein